MMIGGVGFSVFELVCGLMLCSCSVIGLQSCGFEACCLDCCITLVDFGFDFGLGLGKCFLLRI